MQDMLPKGYSPRDDEEFMNPHMRLYFKERLQEWKEDLTKEIEEIISKIYESRGEDGADMLDVASNETILTLELRTKDRAEKLMKKVDEALIRIENGTYGYCLETKEPIEIKRLMARPVARYSVEAQERHERFEQTHQDDKS